MSFYAFLTSGVCVQRLLIKFEVASVYGHYYSDVFNFTLLVHKTGNVILCYFNCFCTLVI